MGNKNTSPPKGPDTGSAQEDEAVVTDSATGKEFCPTQQATSLNFQVNHKDINGDTTVITG